MIENISANRFFNNAVRVLEISGEQTLEIRGRFWFNKDEQMVIGYRLQRKSLFLSPSDSSSIWGKQSKALYYWLKWIEQGHLESMGCYCKILCIAFTF